MKTCLFLSSLGSLFSQGLTLTQAADHALALGFDAVEPYPAAALRDADTEAAARFGAYCREKGLAIPCFSMGINLACADREAQTERLIRFVDCAAAMGAGIFHHTLVLPLAYQAPGSARFSEMLPPLLDSVRRVCEHAAARGVRCAYEDQGYVVNGCERFEAFLDAANHPNIGVVADLGNIYFADEGAQDFVGRFAPQIIHVHLKDYLYKSGADAYPGRGWHRTRGGHYLRDTVFGHGVVPFTQVFAILQRAGFDGYFSAEYGAPEPLMQGLADGMDNMRRFYEDAKRSLSQAGHLPVL